jgi:hypothetical protein
MTAYVVSYDGFSSATTPPPVAYDYLATTYPIRIARIDVFAFGLTGFVLTNYSGASLSGGTSIIPLPLRGGTSSPAATTIVKTGAAISGGLTIIDTFYAGTDSLASAGLLTYTTYQQGSNSFTSGYDYIIPVGSALRFSFGTATNVVVATTVYFEEVRLNLSF